MARVTVEDCVDKVPNRFDLVMLAAHRAREITAGSPVTVDRDNDKNPVVALREIADETQPLDELRERMIEHLDQTEASLARLRGPIGIYIGSKTPPEIAVSVMAEILAVKNSVALPPETAVAVAKELTDRMTDFV